MSNNAITTDTIAKMSNGINFDLALKIDASIIKKLTFVPINIQNDSLFVAVTLQADEDAIKKYLNDIFSNNVIFIHLNNVSHFKMLFDKFFIELSKRDSSIPQYTFEIPKEESSNDDLNILDNDFNIQLDEGDLLSDDNELAMDDNELSNEYDSYDNEEIYEYNDSYDANGFSEEDINYIPDDKDDDDDFDLAPPPLIKEDDPTGDGKASADISKVKAPQTKKLGEILIEEKLITQEQLEIALAESKAQKIPLGSIMVKLGFVKMKDLKEALGAQMGLKYATAAQLKALPTAVSILPEEFVKANKVIPLSITDKSLVIGMVNPSDTKVINEVIYQTGLKPSVVVVTHVEFENFLNTYYNVDKQATEDLLERISKDDSLDQDSGNLFDMAEQEIHHADGSVAQLANKIVVMAIERRASDIHIEPLSTGYRVRLRIDGSLQEVLKIPQKVESAVISRFKVLSKMNIAEHRRMQDGSFTMKYKNRAQDFRVNTLPVAGKEKMVIRVLAPQMSAAQARADKITIEGALDDDIHKMEYLVSCPHGIVLTSGPTGSGKTTTLYALLRYLNSDSVNITTIEDPVEIKLDGINQSSINTKAGITFANSLRAILRQDPDTILIGEIRDYETLEVAISASLTGHLVLSTIHTNSAASTITRLIEMGAKDYLISSTVSGIVAQRLVKKLCNNCKEEYYPSEEEARKILTDPTDIKKFMQTKIYKPHGCPNCKNTGYLGRLAVLEILVINKEIRKMISQRAHDIEIEEYAVKQGMRTLRNSCLRHILNGDTSIDEQVRILGLVGDS